MQFLAFLVAFGCWLVVANAAVRLAVLSPRGARFATLQRLGMWNFTPIRAAIGPTADVHILAYKRGFLGFFLCILGFIALTAWSILSGNLNESAPLPSTSASP